MPSTTKNINIENFYNTLITSDIAATGDVSFTVAVAPAGTSNTKGFVIVEPNDNAKRERMFYTRSGSTLNVMGINRFNPNAHLAGATIKMNDTAEVFNFLQANISTTFYVEPLGGLSVNVWGGPVLVSQSSVSVADTVINLAYPLNYIYYDTATNAIGNTNIEGNATGPIVAEVSASGGFYTGTVYRNHKFGVFGGVDDVTLQVDPTTKEMEIKSVPGSLITMALDELSNVVVPTPTVGQALTWSGTNWVNSNLPSGSGDGVNPVAEGALLDWIPNTELKITLTTGVYTIYNLTGVYVYGADDTQLSAQVSTGVYNDTTKTLNYVGLGMNVNVLNGSTTSNTSGFAFLANQNTFSAPQIFQDTVSFTSLVLFPYHENTTNTSLFNAAYGAKQKFSFTDASSHTLTFANLRAGGNYVFTINVSGGTSTLVRPTPITDFTDCNTIQYMYKYGTTTYPLSLTNGVHTFVAEAFSTAIHVQYLGISIAA